MGYKTQTGVKKFQISQKRGCVCMRNDAETHPVISGNDIF